MTDGMRVVRNLMLCGLAGCVTAAVVARHLSDDGNILVINGQVSVVAIPTVVSLDCRPPLDGTPADLYALAAQRDRLFERLLDYASTIRVAVHLVPPKGALGEYVVDRRRILVSPDVPCPVRLWVLIHELAHALDIEVYSYRANAKRVALAERDVVVAKARHEAVARVVANKIWRSHGWSLEEITPYTDVFGLEPYVTQRAMDIEMIERIILDAMRAEEA